VRDEQLCLLAASLVAAGLRLVVVGSLARRWGGEDVAPHDLDIVVVDTPENLATLSRALDHIGARPISAHRFETSFGLLDVFLSKGPGNEFPTFEIAGIALSFDPRPHAA
jgi:hypothetical protein